MKKLFLVTLFTLVPSVLYGALRENDALTHFNDDVDWKCQFALVHLLKSTPLCQANKQAVYAKAVALKPKDLLCVIDMLIDHAFINNPADLDLFCVTCKISEQLSDEQKAGYKKELERLNALEEEMFDALCDLRDDPLVIQDKMQRLKSFFEKGARVNAQNARGSMLLPTCTSYYWIVELLLLQPTININAKAVARGGSTALMEAMWCAPETIQLLLQQPYIDVNARKESDDSTALIHAARYPEAVALLLQEPKIDVNAQDDKGKTALMHAVGHREILDSAIVRLLLERPDIQVNLKRDNGCTALEIAKKFGNREIVKMLKADPRIENISCILQ